jgi:hypothetical protein
MENPPRLYSELVATAYAPVSALTAEQCAYFVNNRKDRICHATGSGTFRPITVSLNDRVRKHT